MLIHSIVSGIHSSMPGTVLLPVLRSFFGNRIIDLRMQSMSGALLSSLGRTQEKFYLHLFERDHSLEIDKIRSRIDLPDTI
jgi:hypothetical protein